MDPFPCSLVVLQAYGLPISSSDSTFLSIRVPRELLSVRVRYDAAEKSDESKANPFPLLLFPFEKFSLD